MTSHRISLWDSTPENPDGTPVPKKGAGGTWRDVLKKKFAPKANSRITDSEVEAGAKKLLQTRIDRKHTPLGVRWAIIAFLVGLLVQTAVSIPFMVAAMNTMLATNETINNSSLTDTLLAPQNLFWLQFASYVGWFAVGVWATWRHGTKSFIKDFWFRIGKPSPSTVARLKSYGKDILFGLLIAVGVRLLEQVLYWIFGVLNLNMTGSDNSTPFTTGDGVWKYVLLFGIVSLLGPISEEFLFRGLLLQGLLRNFNHRPFVPKTWFGNLIQSYAPYVWSAFFSLKTFLWRYKYAAAAIVSAVSFGAMHFQGFDTFGQIWVVIETGLIGLLFAVITLRTKRMGVAITGHCFFNLTGVILTLTLGG